MPLGIQKHGGGHWALERAGLPVASLPRVKRGKLDLRPESTAWAPCHQSGVPLSHSTVQLSAAASATASSSAGAPARVGPVGVQGSAGLCGMAALLAPRIRKFMCRGGGYQPDRRAGDLGLGRGGLPATLAVLTGANGVRLGLRCGAAPAGRAEKRAVTRAAVACQGWEEAGCGAVEMQARVKWQSRNSLPPSCCPAKHHSMARLEQLAPHNGAGGQVGGGGGVQQGGSDGRAPGRLPTVGQAAGRRAVATFFAAPRPARALPHARPCSLPHPPPLRWPQEKNHWRRFHWRYIIIDEAHRIKNENSRLSQVRARAAWVRRCGAHCEFAGRQLAPAAGAPLRAGLE